ncbi:CoA transferase [Bradyrhizobium sp. CCBAU 11430]|uniref:CoA transferase n=1 Tax=Bradyrhizobium sp. CCBAU 11430 TaxID=1630881 RepID=UPI00230501FE|nr:CoA transferase [Bradyrhizobium sp. CCBAU 11430]
MLVVGNDAQFARAYAELGAPELATDPRFLKNNDRVANDNEIMAIFAGLHTLAHWLENLEKGGVPCGPLNDFSQVLADPHVRARGMRVNVKHQFAPELSLIRNALTFSETPITDYRVPPLLGENTLEVLAGKLGYDDVKIAKLKQRGNLAGGA